MLSFLPHELVEGVLLYTQRSHKSYRITVERSRESNSIQDH